MGFVVQISFALFMDEDTEPGEAEDRKVLTDRCLEFVRDELFQANRQAFEAFHREFVLEEARPGLRRVEELIRRHLRDGGKGAGIPDAQGPRRPLQIEAPASDTPYDPTIQLPYGYTLIPPKCDHPYVVLDDREGSATADLSAGAGPEELRAHRIPIKDLNVTTRGHLGVRLQFWSAEAPEGPGGGPL